FFTDKAHTFVPSSTTCPTNDPSLRDTFANAGMNQYKPIFQGTLDPNSPLQGLTRATNTQKCIRAGGKHNDLDDVGKDTYHHTFFEMLGNWSFGDYFKAETIEWAWELMTGPRENGCFGLDPKRFYASYFGGDEKAGLEPDLEAKMIWEKFLPPERVMPFDMKDNFWEMGDTGPCGPCSELHYDRVGNRDASSLVNADDPEVIELWNLVFIQYDRLEGGKLSTLPAQHVDTGLGLERIVSVLQDKNSNYDTDVFMPIFDALVKLTGAREYTGKLGAEDTDGVDEAYRVIGDHIRTLVFAITDGGMPSNEGRGYVLRRILRRAVRYGRQKLGAPEGFLANLAPTVIEMMGDAFPELVPNGERVIGIIAEEETSFGKTLDKGMVLLEFLKNAAYGNAYAISKDWKWSGHMDSKHQFLKKDGSSESATLDKKSMAIFVELQGVAQPELCGEDAFKLYDTYGFPIDLTQIIAHEQGLKVDLAGFEKAMEKAKQRSRQGGRKETGEQKIELRAEQIAKLGHLNVKPTDDSFKFSGRDMKGTVKAIWNGHNFDDHADSTNAGTHRVGVVLNKTNFYSEMGGQVADIGELQCIKTGAHFKVEDTQSFGGYVLHIGRITKGKLSVGHDALCQLKDTHRSKVSSNHTTTHLLNFALREVLGNGIDQRGSSVDDEKLRFDFTHSQPVSADEIAKIEEIVNDQIKQNLTVYADLAPLENAQKISGLRAVFGETYPDPVRVVSIGIEVGQLMNNPQNDAWKTVSIEFCGGTHIETTGVAQRFALLSEEGIAKGVRRIFALTGQAAIDACHSGNNILTEAIALVGVDDSSLAKEHRRITELLVQTNMPASIRNRIRVLLAEAQKRLKEAAKAGAAEQAKKAQELASGIAQSAASSPESIIIASLELGSDRKALEAALKTITSACPNKAVMLMSPDTDAGRVGLMAVVPSGLVAQGLKAGNWIQEVAGIMGGKGGGRPDNAQGSGSDISKLKEATSHARTYAFGQIN
ncbi:MAG: alanine--tRNA ligase, partial [Phycisphaerales bacterium]|nr:alanine--tRNA ligase [Phycisphaerales bacterium]